MATDSDPRMLNAFEAIYYIVGRELTEHQAKVGAEINEAIFAGRQAISRSQDMIARRDRTLVRDRALFC
jgi:hypothetical protein